MAAPRRGPRGYVPPKRAPQRTTLRPESGPFRGFIFRNQADHDRQWKAYRSYSNLKLKGDKRRVWKLSERFMFLFEVTREGRTDQASFFFQNLQTNDELDKFIDALTKDPRYPANSVRIKQISYKVG